MNDEMIKNIAKEEIKKKESEKTPISNKQKYYFNYAEYLRLRGDQE